MNEHRYHVIAADEREALMKERLKTVEVEHFRLMLEVRLARVLNTAEAEIVAAESHLAALEVQIAALARWLGIEETIGA